MVDTVDMLYLHLHHYHNSKVLYWWKWWSLKKYQMSGTIHLGRKYLRSRTNIPDQHTIGLALQSFAGGDATLWILERAWYLVCQSKLASCWCANIRISKMSMPSRTSLLSLISYRSCQQMMWSRMEGFTSVPRVDKVLSRRRSTWSGKWMVGSFATGSLIGTKILLLTSWNFGLMFQYVSIFRVTLLMLESWARSLRVFMFGLLRTLQFSQTAIWDSLTFTHLTLRWTFAATPSQRSRSHWICPRLCWSRCRKEPQNAQVDI